MPETQAGIVYLGVKLDDQQFKRQMATLAGEAQRIMQKAVSGGTFQLDTSAIEKSINNVTRSVDTLGDNIMSTFSRSMERGAVDGIRQTAKVVSTAKFPKVKIEFSEARLREQIDLMGQRWQALDAQRVAQAREVARLQTMAQYSAGSPQAAKANEELARAQIRLVNIKMSAAQADAQVYALEQQLERMGQVGQAAPQKTTMAMDQMQYSAQRTGFRVSSAMSGMATASRSAFTRFANGAKTFISRLKDMVKHLNIFRRSSGSAFGGMNPLMKFGLMAMGIRSIYMLVRRLVNTVREGFEEMGKQFDGFAGKLTRLKDSLGTLKASFAGVLAPAFEALLPMIETVVSRLVDAFNTIGIFMARIFGQSTYKMVTGYNSAVEASAGAASASDEAHKKLFRTLASFDELEILRGPDTTGIGTGGVGGGGATAGSPIYKEIAIEPFLGTFSLADMINQWVAGIDATAIGRQISDKFSSAFEAAYTFIEEIDWSGLGVKIGEAWNAIRTIFSFFKGMADLLAGWLKTTNWKAIGTSIGKAISDLDWAGTLTSIVDVIWLSFSSIVQLLANLLQNTDWKKIGTAIWTALSGINWRQLIVDLASLIGSFFGAAFGVLWGLLKGAWNSIKYYWQQYFFDNGRLTFESFFKGINSLLGKGAKFFIDIATALIAGLLDALGLHTEADKVRAFGVEVGQAFEEGFLKGMEKLGEKMWKKMKSTITDPFGMDSLFTDLFGPSSSATGYKPPSTTSKPSTSTSTKGLTRFAAGGYIKQPTLAMIGEDHKREVALPLDRNTEWADILAQRIAERSSGGGAQNVTIPVYLGTDTLVDVIEVAIDRQGRIRNAAVF